MAYCDRCGAYIPDGQGVCLACGFDPDEEAKQSKRAAAAQVQRERQERYEREEAERRRAERQAYDRLWAENEQRRRREEEEFRRRKEEQEQRRREFEEGKARVFVDRDGSQNVQLGDKVRDFFNSDAVNQMEKGVEQAGGKVLPILSYLGPLCFLSLILGNDKFTKFHAGQGVRLFIWGAILQGVGSMFGVGWAFGVFQVLMAIIGIKNAVNGEEKKLPYIGG